MRCEKLYGGYHPHNFTKLLKFYIFTSHLSIMNDLLISYEDWKPQKGFGVVYEYIFENGKRYIGITRYTVMRRYHNHLRANNIVDKALKKYKHKIKILYILPESELSSMEIKLIQQYNTTYPNGYNYTFGGEGQKALPEIRQKISKTHIGDKNPMWGKHYIRKPEVTEKIRQSIIKKVRCIDTGVVYESLTEAEKATNTPIAKINVCCKGYRDTANGHHWEYTDYPDLANFNTICRCYAKSINWQNYLEENKEQNRQRGIELAKSNVGKKRGPYKKH